MPAPQSYKSHARTDLAHHPAMLVLFLNVIVAIVWAFLAHTPGLPLRMWGLPRRHRPVGQQHEGKNKPPQSPGRVIRLEEQLRYTAVLSPAQLALAETLPTRSLIALRFATDAQLPQLVERAAAENLSPKQIKQAIAPWRPDTQRV